MLNYLPVVALTITLEAEKLDFTLALSRWILSQYLIKIVKTRMCEFFALTEISQTKLQSPVLQHQGKNTV